MDGCGKPQPKTKKSLCRRSALRYSGFLQPTASAESVSASSLRTLQGNWWQITTKNEIDNPSQGSLSHFFRWGYFAIAPSFLLVSGESCGAGTFHSAGLLGAAFVRGAAGVQDRHELLQLLEGADTQFVVDVLVVEAQGAVLDVQLLRDLPGAQPGGVAVKDAAFGLGQDGNARIVAVGAGQLGQPAAHAAQHQRVPGGHGSSRRWCRC